MQEMKSDITTPQRVRKLTDISELVESILPNAIGSKGIIIL